MSSLDYLDLCRLCLVKDRVSVPIFEDEGDVRQIFLKITACLPVKVSRDDKLPKKICDDCVYKVELFYQFWNTTASAEKQLLQWLGEVGGLEDKQGYVTEVLDTNVMKQERNSDNRLDGSVLQVSGHQNSMDMGMMDNISLITMPAGNEQQFAPVPIDTSGTVQTVQAVPGPSTQNKHDAMTQSQTSVSHLVEEEEESEEDENSDDGCDNEEGLPVKEETEDDQTDRPLEPTTFVSLPCDEAGPSGLQQQKISEISEMTMSQTTDGDPKTGLKRTRTRMPAILQRKRKVEAVESPNRNGETKNKLSLLHSTTMIVTNKNNLQSVLKTFDGFVFSKPFVRSGNIHPSISIISSNQKDTMQKDEHKSDFDETEVKVLEVAEDDVTGELIEEEEEEEGEGEGEGEEIEDETIRSYEVEPEQNTFPCDSCDESFNDRSALIIHKTEKSIVRTRAALREPMVKYECDICKRLFTSKGMLARHYKNCGVLELDTLPVTYRRRRARSLARPKKDKENEEGPVTCDKCNKVFKKGKYLKVHVSMAHGEHITCQLCEARLGSVSLLKAHMSEAHSGDFTEFCKICNKGFYLRQSLKIHLAAHTRDDKPCICQICQKSFRHEVYLRKHVQLVHVELRDHKKYRCEQCGYETHYKACFREHVYKHTGEDLIECQVCSKRMRRSYMRIHLRIHTGEKPEICEYCGKGFSARKYLTKHRVTHTGEKPYQCQICGKRYTQRGTLTLHFKKIHPQEVSGASARSCQTKCSTNEEDESEERSRDQVYVQSNEDEDAKEEIEYEEEFENCEDVEKIKEMRMEDLAEEEFVNNDNAEVFKEELQNDDGEMKVLREMEVT